MPEYSNETKLPFADYKTALGERGGARQAHVLTARSNETRGNPVCCEQQGGPYLVSSGMLLFRTQLLWRCTESCVLVGGVGAAGLGWLRVVIDLRWRESAVGGGFLAQVHA